MTTLTPEQDRDTNAALEACMRLVKQKRDCPECPVVDEVERVQPWLLVITAGTGGMIIGLVLGLVLR